MKHAMARLYTLFRVGGARHKSTYDRDIRRSARVLVERQEQVRAEEQSRLRQYPTGGGAFM